MELILFNKVIREHDRDAETRIHSKYPLLIIQFNNRRQDHSISLDNLIY